ncbi:hypothetical protein [Clostridium sp. HBUAS56010]|uniref:hypothetical protein n=1 Tax=Clostridium sp. HBUAS56010 TaxID=2571127 RepID=UPI0011782339|nr:hypothetical protein [Clostridium sp. HBUAS56010]
MSEYSTTDMETGEWVQVYDLEKCLKAIRVRDKRNEDLIEKLKTMNKELREEYDRDNEIQKMQMELKKVRSDYYRGFPISESEKEAIDEWCNEHDKSVHGLDTLGKRLKAGGCCGGRYSYHFVPTSIGVSGTIKCHCGAEFEFQRIG